MSLTHNVGTAIRDIGEFVHCRISLLTPDNFFHADPGVLVTPNGLVIGLNLHGVGLVDAQLNSLITRKMDLLQALRYLDLSNNKLQSVAVLSNLKDLVKLDLASNRITDVRFVLDMPNLKTANLRCNRLARVPDEIFASKLDVKIHDDWTGGLILEGNPILSPSREDLEERILRQKAQRYEKLLSDGVYSRNECRIQLIGSGGAGKTTLAKSLAGRPHLPNEPATRGMAIWEVLLDDIRVKIWDFGGQEAMFSAHRLFIAGGEIFLIVLDSRHNEIADGWIEFVLSFCPDARFVIVMNKIDENITFDLDQGSLRRMHQNRILGFFRISANKMTEDRFVDFKKQLGRILSKFAKTGLPLKFRPLLTSFERSEEPLIREAEFRKTLGDSGLRAENLDLALDQLIRIGIVIRTELAETGRVLVRSSWLAKNIYPLLEPDLCMRDEVNNGLISGDDLFNIWLATREQEGFKAIKKAESRELFRVLTEIMERNGLCYRAEDGFFFVPNFLNANSPDVSEYLPQNQPYLHFIFECAFLPKLIFQRLHVEIAGRYRVLARWKSGFIVKGSETDFEGNFTCFVMGNFHNREISITSFGDNRSTGFRDMYKLVKDRLAGVGSLVYQEYIVYHEATASEKTAAAYRLRFKDIIYHHEMQKQEYPCGEYRRTFNVSSVLRGIPEVVTSQGRTSMSSEEEWWNALRTLATELYPKGPTELMVWVRSGGDVSLVDTSQPGMTQWIASLQKLRNGGGGKGITVERMLCTMKQDYSSNREIENLLRSRSLNA